MMLNPREAVAKNYYEILDVARNATIIEVRRAYKTLGRIKHPDRNLSNPNAKEEFQALQAAYSTLVDPQKRRDYNKTLARPIQAVLVSAPKIPVDGDQRSLIVPTAVSLEDTIINSSLHKEDLLKMAKVNKDFALALLRLKRLKRYNLARLGAMYEDIALMILNDAAQLELLDWQKSSYNICILAEAHVNVCLSILTEVQLAPLAQQLTAKELHQLAKKHGQVVIDVILQQPELAPRYNAYNYIYSCASGSIAIDSIQLSDAMQTVRLTDDYYNYLLREIIQQESVALAFVRIGAFKGINLAWLGEKYESIAMTILSDDNLLTLLDWRNQSQNITILAHAHPNVCRLIFTEPKLSDLAKRLDAEEIHRLVERYGNDVLNLIISNKELVDKYNACEFLVRCAQLQAAEIDPILLRSAIAKVLTNRNYSIRLMKLFLQNEMMALEVLQTKAFKGVDLAKLGEKFERVALAILDDPQQVEALRNGFIAQNEKFNKKFEKSGRALRKKLERLYALALGYQVQGLAILALAHERVCKIILSNSALAESLNGDELQQILNRYPQFIELILQNSIVFKCLDSFMLLQSAMENTGTTIKEDQASDFVDPSEESYNRGAFYLSHPDPNWHVIAAKCFLDAATMGNERGLQAYIECLKTTFAEDNNAQQAVHEASIAALYANDDMPFCDMDEALKWNCLAATHDPKHFSQLCSCVELYPTRSDFDVVVIQHESGLIRSIDSLISSSLSSEVEQCLIQHADELYQHFMNSPNRTCFQLGRVVILSNLIASDYLILTPMRLTFAEKNPTSSEDSPEDALSHRINRTLPFSISSIENPESVGFTSTVRFIDELLQKGQLQPLVAQNIMAHPILSSKLPQGLLAAVVKASESVSTTDEIQHQIKLVKRIKFELNRPYRVALMSRVIEVWDNKTLDQFYLCLNKLERADPTHSLVPEILIHLLNNPQQPALTSTIERFASSYVTHAESVSHVFLNCDDQGRSPLSVAKEKNQDCYEYMLCLLGDKTILEIFEQGYPSKTLSQRILRSPDLVKELSKEQQKILEFIVAENPREHNRDLYYEFKLDFVSPGARTPEVKQLRLIQKVCLALMEQDEKQLSVYLNELEALNNPALFTSILAFAFRAASNSMIQFLINRYGNNAAIILGSGSSIESPLSLAKRHPDKSFYHVLVRNLGDKAKLPNGATPLYQAIREKNKEEVKLFRTYCPNSHVLGDPKWDPLAVAIETSGEFTDLLLFDENQPKEKRQKIDSPLLLLQEIINRASRDKRYYPALIKARGAFQTSSMSYLLLAILGLAISAAIIGYTISIFATGGASLSFLPLIPHTLNLTILVCSSAAIMAGLLIATVSAVGIYKQTNERSIIHQADQILSQSKSSSDIELGQKDSSTDNFTARVPA